MKILKPKSKYHIDWDCTSSMENWSKTYPHLLKWQTLKNCTHWIKHKENSWISCSPNSAKAFVPKHANREVIEILSEDDLELKVDIRLKCKADQNAEISQSLADNK